MLHISDIQNAMHSLPVPDTYPTDKIVIYVPIMSKVQSKPVAARKVTFVKESVQKSTCKWLSINNPHKVVVWVFKGQFYV